MNIANQQSVIFSNEGMTDGVNRPMTGIRGVGYPGTAAGGGSASRRGVFDPLNQAVKSAGSGGSPAGLDNSKREETPEDKIKALEKKVKTFRKVGLNRLCRRNIIVICSS